MAAGQRSTSVEEKGDHVPVATMEDGKGDTSETVEAPLYIDPAEEKKLLLKLDLFLTPVIMLVYLCCFLDRSNIGPYLSFFISDFTGDRSTNRCQM